MFDEVLTRWPHVPNLYRMLGHSPEMFKAWLNVAWPLRMDAKTPRRTRELMILHGARISETAYEWAHHVPLALQAGVTQAEIDAIFDGEFADSISEAERVALQLADEITRGPAASEACIAAVCEHYSESETIELTLTASFYVCVGRMLKSLAVPLEKKFPEPGRPGSHAWGAGCLWNRGVHLQSCLSADDIDI